MNNKSAASAEVNNMNCTLCGSQIKNYNPVFNHIPINDTRSADICTECVQKIVKWQQDIYAKLFPTKAAKKLTEKEK